MLELVKGDPGIAQTYVSHRRYREFLLHQVHDAILVFLPDCNYDIDQEGRLSERMCSR